MSMSDISEFLGRPGVYAAGAETGSGDVAYVSTTQLALSNLPFAPQNIQFLGTIMYGATGGLRPYPATAYRHSYSAPNLTVANAQFTTGSGEQYVVVYYKGTKITGDTYCIKQTISTGGQLTGVVPTAGSTSYYDGRLLQYNADAVGGRFDFSSLISGHVQLIGITFYFATGMNPADTWNAHIWNTTDGNMGLWWTGSNQDLFWSADPQDEKGVIIAYDDHIRVTSGIVTGAPLYLYVFARG